MPTSVKEGALLGLLKRVKSGICIEHRSTLIKPKALRSSRRRCCCCCCRGRYRNEHNKMHHQYGKVSEIADDLVFRIDHGKIALCRIDEE